MQEKNGPTPSERLVTGLCQRSFLKLWTHPNPNGKHGKELCDCLVVCGPHIVIISVKDSQYRDTGSVTGWNRWARTAIAKSVAQISGAERWLQTTDRVRRRDGRAIALPERSIRQYHRIAVALGGKGNVPLQWGDFGDGFVHLCDEYSIDALFSALDTITDFVEFLDASESLVKGNTRLHFDGGGIEDLVALYLLNGRSFEVAAVEKTQPDMLILSDDLWRGLVASEEFGNMQTEFKPSYAWDGLIDHFAIDLLTGGMFDMHGGHVSDDESALITMALEPRHNRVLMGKALLELLQNPKLNSAARVVGGSNGCAYVFTLGSSQDREFRMKELALRCLVVRGRLPNAQTVVGIATDRPGTSTIGYSSDIVYMHMPQWTTEDERRVREIQEALGYFGSVAWSATRAPASGIA